MSVCLLDNVGQPCHTPKARINTEEMRAIGAFVGVFSHLSCARKRRMQINSYKSNARGEIPRKHWGFTVGHTRPTVSYGPTAKRVNG